MKKYDGPMPAWVMGEAIFSSGEGAMAALAMGESILSSCGGSMAALASVCCLANISYHQKSLDIKIRVCGQDSLDVADSYTGLGYVYESRGKYKEALEMHRKSLDIKTRILVGHSHPSVAESHVGIGNVLEAMVKYEEALVQLQKGR
jgi:tetratricopeptide (TPR) repeat protein